MDGFIEALKQYGGYIGLPLIVAGITQALKLGLASFFRKNAMGIRLMPFIPVVLGMVGGLLLPIESVREQILVGGGLGTISIFIYKAVTQTFASAQNVEGRKSKAP